MSLPISLIPKNYWKCGSPSTIFTSYKNYTPTLPNFSVKSYLPWWYTTLFRSRVSPILAREYHLWISILAVVVWTWWDWEQRWWIHWGGGGHFFSVFSGPDGKTIYHHHRWEILGWGWAYHGVLGSLWYTIALMISGGQWIWWYYSLAQD